MTTTDQERLDLRTSLRHLLDGSSSSEAVRSALETPTGHDPQLWQQMVELGYASIHVPEDLGGGGAGYGELAIVLHELGRHLTPSPFLSSAVLATGALLAAHNDELRGELIPQLVNAERVGTIAVASAAGSVDAGQLSMRWTKAGDGIELSGSSAFVPDAQGADVMIVAARGEDGVCALAVVDTDATGVTVESTPTADLTRRVSTVTLHELRVSRGRLLCDPGASTDVVLQRIIALAAIALMVDAVGVAERCVELSSEYAKERMQFGRPIGSFQAVKHHCANMLIALECSKAAALAGIEALDDPNADLQSAASVAKSYAGPACAGVAALGIQVHGGIGFTWEHDSHMLLKRAKFDEAWFGTPAWYRRRLARTLLPQGKVR